MFFFHLRVFNMCMFCTLGYACRNKNANINCLAEDIKHFFCRVSTMVLASFRSRLQHPDLEAATLCRNSPVSECCHETAKGSVTTQLRFLSASYAAEDVSLRHLIVTVFISSLTILRWRMLWIDTQQPHTAESCNSHGAHPGLGIKKNISSKTRVFPPNLRDWWILHRATLQPSRFFCIAKHEKKTLLFPIIMYFVEDGNGLQP